MKKLFYFKGNHGFTLIELLVVIAIIGLLSSIVFASLSGARAKGRVASAQGSMRNVITAAILCQDEGGGTVNIIGTAGIAETDANSATTNVCSLTSVTATTYGALPTGWIYCDDTVGTQSATNCGNDISLTSPLSLSAEGDGRLINCTESGCTMVVDSN